MKIILLLSLFWTTISCTNLNVFRSPSSTINLSGTYLGSAKYKRGRKGVNRPAVRIYFKEIEGEEGSYHAVLLEYVDLIGMSPQFISSTVTPAANKVIGYLKNITRKVAAYKVIPTGHGTYEMIRLSVSGNEVQAISNNNSTLVLDSNASAENPLSNAKIMISKSGEEAQIRFASPEDDERDRLGLQYGMASKIYKLASLKSTWRDNYLTGDYLAAYAKLDDKVLDLSRDNGQMRADFTINLEQGYYQKDIVKGWRTVGKKGELITGAARENIFTSRKSAYISGPFNVTKADEGIFVFEAMKDARPPHNDAHHVEGRIGLFIDIFDRSAQGQDVVELILINPKDSEDFLMYYEHPDNGEGDSEESN
jgi:hypothetical protein